MQKRERRRDERDCIAEPSIWAGRYEIDGVLRAIGDLCSDRLPRCQSPELLNSVDYRSRSQAIPTVVVCLGLATVVMAGGDDVVSGGIDLSIPSIAVLAAAIVADQVTNQGNSLLFALSLGLGAALCAGIVNALLVVSVGMTPLLATLASGAAYVGISQVITHSRRINVSDPFIVDGQVWGIPIGVLAALALAVIFFAALHRTRWGLNLKLLAAIAMPLRPPGWRRASSSRYRSSSRASRAVWRPHSC